MVYYSPRTKASERYFQLLERIADVLQTHRHDRHVRKALNNIRDYQARIRERLHLPQKVTELAVTMLLAREDWPARIKTYKINTMDLRVELHSDMLWVAFRGRPKRLGLTGIDLKEKKLVALWEAENSSTPELTGMVVSKHVTYLSLSGLGLMVFPGAVTTGREFLKNPKVLGQEQGLPSVRVTGMTGNGDKLWIGYGGALQESGLGIYEPGTGHWETVLCSTLEAESPFSRGQPYMPYELSLGPMGKLFFQIWDPQFFLDRQAMGLWKIDTNTRELKYFGLGGIPKPARGRLINFGREWWFKTPWSLTQFDPIREKTRLILGDPCWLKWGRSGKLQRLSFEHDLFVPEASNERLASGPCWIHGNLDLSTATIHGDRLWARLGDSQIIIVHRGKSLEEAEIIDNNILNGGKVLEFLSTPYGLIAIGEGTVGLIETESN